MSIPVQNITAGFDPTSPLITTLTAAQLKQLIDGAQAAADKGFIIVTTDTPPSGSPPLPSPDVPNVDPTTGNPALKRYIWLRIQSNGVVPYIWIESAGVHNDQNGKAINKWYTLAASSLGINVVTGGLNGNIAIATITDDNMANPGMSAGKLSGNLPDAMTVTFVKKTDVPLGTVLGNNYGTPTLQNDAVTTPAILAKNVTNAKLEDGDATHGITPNKFQTDVAKAKYILRQNDTGGAVEFASVQIADPTKTNGVGVGDVGKIPRIAAGGLTYELVSPLVGAGITKQVITGITIGAIGSATNQAHTLAAVPDLIIGRFVCGTADAATGYAIGDEIPIEFICGDSGGGTPILAGAAIQIHVPATAGVPSTTLVTIVRNSLAGTVIMTKTGGTYQFPTNIANFTLKLTLIKFP